MSSNVGGTIGLCRASWPSVLSSLSCERLASCWAATRTVSRAFLPWATSCRSDSVLRSSNASRRSISPARALYPSRSVSSFALSRSALSRALRSRLNSYSRVRYRALKSSTNARLACRQGLGAAGTTHDTGAEELGHDIRHIRLLVVRQRRERQRPLGVPVRQELRVERRDGHGTAACVAGVGRHWIVDGESSKEVSPVRVLITRVVYKE